MSRLGLDSCFEFFVIFLTPAFHDRLQGNVNIICHTSCSSTTDLECYRSRRKPPVSAPAGRTKHSYSHVSSNACTSALKPIWTGFLFEAHHRVPSSGPYNQILIYPTSSKCDVSDYWTFRRRGPRAFHLWLNAFLSDTWIPFGGCPRCRFPTLPQINEVMPRYSIQNNNRLFFRSYHIPRFSWFCLS